MHKTFKTQHITDIISEGIKDVKKSDISNIIPTKIMEKKVKAPATDDNKDIKNWREKRIIKGLCVDLDGTAGKDYDKINKKNLFKGIK